MELAVLCQSHVFLAFVDSETGKLVTFNSHPFTELQNLFANTPLQLREQYKTKDVGLNLPKYDRLFGDTDSVTKSVTRPKRRSSLRVKTEEDYDEEGFQELESLENS